jgi:ABC-type sulfate transport system permease component
MSNLRAKMFIVNLLVPSLYVSGALTFIFGFLGPMNSWAAESGAPSEEAQISLFIALVNFSLAVLLRFAQKIEINTRKECLTPNEKMKV